MSGEEEEQEIKNLFEKIMKENFPNLRKEIDFQEVQEAQRVPKKLDSRKHTPKHIIVTLPKMKDKERILKAAREKETVTYKGIPLRLSLNASVGERSINWLPPICGRTRNCIFLDWGLKPQPFGYREGAPPSN